MHLLRTFALAAALTTSGQAFALDGVVASIKPLHSLVAGVMEGVGEPDLLVKGAASPHDYTLRPSDAVTLQRAKLVFWVGPGMEAFLTRPLGSLASGARAVELSEADGLTLLPFREGGPFEAHSHGHGDDAHDADDHDHEASGHDHEEEGHAGHDHGHEDMHFWLDPENGKVMVRAIEAALADVDPENASTYAANAERVTARIDALSADLATKLADAKGKPFIVFHDAYQYFERRFGLTAAGSITVSPETMPGADRLTRIREKLTQSGAACVFAEPNFEPRLVNLVIEGTKARAGVLDPEGAALDAGPDLYFRLLEGLGSSIATCLDQAG